MRKLLDIGQPMGYIPRMTSQQLHQHISETKGRFFSITFVKNDGSIRKANGKNVFNRLLRGGESTVENAGFVSFVDRNKDSWICAKGERVLEFKCGSLTVNA